MSQLPAKLIWTVTLLNFLCGKSPKISVSKSAREATEMSTFTAPPPAIYMAIPTFVLGFSGRGTLMANHRGSRRTSPRRASRRGAPSCPGQCGARNLKNNTDFLKEKNKSKPSTSQTRTIPAAQEGETEQTVVPGQVRAEQVINAGHPDPVAHKICSTSSSAGRAPGPGRWKTQNPGIKVEWWPPRWQWWQPEEWKLPWKQHQLY